MTNFDALGKFGLKMDKNGRTWTKSGQTWTENGKIGVKVGKFGINMRQKVTFLDTVHSSAASR